MGRRVSLVNLLNSENLPDAPKCQTNKATGLKNSELVHLCTSYPSLWEKKTMHPLGCIKAWEMIPTPGWWIFFSFWVCFGHFCCTWSKNQLILNLLCGFVGSQFIANSFQKQTRHDELTQGSEKIIRLPILEGSNLMQTYGKFLSFKNVLFGVVSHNDCMWVEKPMRLLRPRPRPDIFSDGVTLQRKAHIAPHPTCQRQMKVYIGVPKALKKNIFLVVTGYWGGGSIQCISISFLFPKWGISRYLC